MLLIAAALAALAGPAAAVNPDEQLADPALEARAVKLSRELRCVVCQNQSIDDSDATLARDLRLVLRERLAAGDTDAEAIGYISARYGSFVQLKPPVRGDTLALWFGPLAVLLAGAIGVFVYLRGRSTVAPLDPAQEAEAERLLSRDKAG